MGTASCVDGSGGTFYPACHPVDGGTVLPSLKKVSQRSWWQLNWLLLACFMSYVKAELLVAFFIQPFGQRGGNVPRQPAYWQVCENTPAYGNTTPMVKIFFMMVFGGWGGKEVGGGGGSSGPRYRGYIYPFKGELYILGLDGVGASDSSYWCLWPSWGELFWSQGQLCFPMAKPWPMLTGSIYPFKRELYFLGLGRDG